MSAATPPATGLILDHSLLYPYLGLWASLLLKWLSYKTYSEPTVQLTADKPKNFHALFIQISSIYQVNWFIHSQPPCSVSILLSIRSAELSPQSIVWNIARSTVSPSERGHSAVLCWHGCRVPLSDKRGLGSKLKWRVGCLNTVSVIADINNSCLHHQTLVFLITELPHYPSGVAIQ